MRGVTSLSILLFSVTITFGQAEHAEERVPRTLECRQCHSCEVPTKVDPCLRSCPRLHMVRVDHSPGEGPEVLVIDELSDFSNIYAPVVFSHRSHAEMTEISGGCSICHHYNPPGGVLPCKDCHQATASGRGADLRKPGLKGAYHRQCIDCHREWSDTIECTSCHALEGVEKTVSATDSKPWRHPSIIEPTRVTYETTFEQGKIVTFFHDEHVKLYSLGCVDCHRNESCVRCHGVQKSVARTEESLEEKHQRCTNCHDVDDACSFCHHDNPIAPFDHARRTGFALTKYHEKLSCQKCHGSEAVFTGLNKDCKRCHAEWESGFFDHRVTGLELDETHVAWACEDCHIDGNFAQKPSCVYCHGDMSYPQYKPGKPVRK